MRIHAPSAPSLAAVFAGAVLPEESALTMEGDAGWFAAALRVAYATH